MDTWRHEDILGSTHIKKNCLNLGIAQIKVTPPPLYEIWAPKEHFPPDVPDFNNVFVQ